MTDEPAQETTKGITEKFSEKPRRGRPPVLTPYVEEGCRRAAGMYQHSTRRANLNEYYKYKAIGALWSHNPEGHDAGKIAFAWLGDPDTDKGVKSTILAELGRLVDEDLIRRTARILCDEKPRTREAVLRLRRMRIAPKSGSVSGLRDELIAHLDDYWVRHPEFTKEQFLDAIAELRWAVEDYHQRA
jgi:hypothetical protein